MLRRQFLSLISSLPIFYSLPNTQAVGSLLQKEPSDYVPALLTNEYILYTNESVFDSHIVPINISKDIGRSQICELGRKKPYFKYKNFLTKLNNESKNILGN